MFVQGIAVAAGGFFGAISRFLVSQWFKNHIHSDFPFATLLVNLLGSFCLGFLIGYGIEDKWILLLGTGFLGSFTTFSTFQLEMIRYLSDKRWKKASLYLITSYVIGLIFAFLGMYVGGS
ncbi:fluoride efflux transporter CrcB [Bacillus sp. KH172YL63]|uniref:fluoride efflux transporter CrcB n=1 Tax=Bacillus sp. KH172YL63 TaxID=2709784 RepID=UPI0013E42CC7|nr:fluoride efflux transporter CrcB [Bacillus sp. KH172YL63]BCB03630.1 putative fluoride ion transporter CrcB 2 [Bacillus sp. KH172YL63]